MVGHQQIKRCGLVHRTSVVPGELDYRVGQILDTLDEAGVAKNTIVVWASDNAAVQLAGTVAGSSGLWRWYFGGGWEGSLLANKTWLNLTLAPRTTLGAS